MPDFFVAPGRLDNTKPLPWQGIRSTKTPDQQHQLADAAEKIQNLGDPTFPAD
jgi:hypothetical protein